MKMGDGGLRPAYNVQFASTCQEQLIVGMEVVNAGSDRAQLAPMVQQVEQRLGDSPAEWLVDGGFPAHGQIDAVAGKTEVYAPVPEPRANKDEPGKPVRQDKHQPKPDDSAAVAAWRQRMAGPEAKEIYKQRAATAECVNAQARNRGLLRMPVRGLAKVRSVVGLFVLAHNLMRIAALAPRLIGWGGTGPYRNGCEGRMRGQVMDNIAKTKRLCEVSAATLASASVTGIASVICPRVDADATNFNQPSLYAGKRKTLGL